MPTDANRIAEAAMALSPDERAKLVERLILSLEAADREALDAEWNAVIDRRLAQIDGGTISLIPFDVAMQRFRERKRV